MPERTKIGPYVDRETWEEFRELVGNEREIGEELDKALRAYIDDPTAQRLKAIIEQELKETETDLSDKESPRGEVVSDVQG